MTAFVLAGYATGCFLQTMVLMAKNIRMSYLLLEGDGRIISLMRLFLKLKAT